MPDTSVIVGNYSIITECDFFCNERNFRLFDFKRFEMVRSNTCTATIASAKRTAIIIAILVMVVRLGGFNFRNSIFTLITRIAARQRRKYHQVKSPYCDYPSHYVANIEK